MDPACLVAQGVVSNDEGLPPSEFPTALVARLERREVSLLGGCDAVGLRQVISL